MGQSICVRHATRRDPGRRVLCALLGVLAAVLFSTACAGGSARPQEVSAPLDSPEAGLTPSATAAEAGRRYDAQGLDVCTRTDLAPLAGLSLSVESRRAKDPSSAPGAACLFELRTQAGFEARLLVEASTLTSTDDAQRLYRTTQQVSGMDPAGAVDGIGDEAEGFTKRSEPGYKNAEYMIHARSRNLVLKVWLAVGGKTFTPEDVLAAKAHAILQSAMSIVPLS